MTNANTNPTSGGELRRLLSADEVAERLRALDGWSRSGSGAIAKRFRFADFRLAFDWMGRVAREAERLDHHPDWKNVYATVEVELTTHDAGGLTALDFELARAMDEHAAAAPGEDEAGA